MAQSYCLGHGPTLKESAYRSIIEHGVVSRELFNFICGDYLGSGISRMVFVYRPKPQWVIKIETDHHNANVIEHNIWRDLRSTDYGLWLAPCGELSSCGRILLQRRCKVPKDKDGYPDRVPYAFTDLKYSNWGTLSGRYVCMDYAGALTNIYGSKIKMKKAMWWDQDSL